MARTYVRNPPASCGKPTGFKPVATVQLAPRKLVTTASVLTEVADALAKPVNRAGFAQLMAMLSRNADAVIVPPTVTLFAEGVALFNARADEEWSLTDCISFVVMTQLDISEARTADHHFEQAGFVALLK